MTRSKRPVFSLDATDGEEIPLPPRQGMEASVHVIDRRSILALESAMATGRPLLVRGVPGTGKSQLARAAAEKLRRALVLHAVDARTETRDLLWTVDAVKRLAEAQVMAAAHGADAAEVARRIDVGRFLHPGALWWAFDWTSAAEQARKAEELVPEEEDARGRAKGAVLLVDEIDKADPSVPNGLLDALGHGRFVAPGPAIVAADPVKRPLVIVTTNEERTLPDAFLRRCLVLHLSLPADPKELTMLLLARGRSHFPGCDDAVIQLAASMLIEDRAECARAGTSPPGVAEFVDLLRVVTRQYSDNKARLTLMKEIREFTFRKHPTESDA